MGDEALAVLKRGEAAYHAGDLAGAERVFRDLIAAGLLDGWATFFLGRVLRARRQVPEALGCFERAPERGGPVFWSLYEQLTLLPSDTTGGAWVAEIVRRLLAIEWEKLEAFHAEELETAAHLAWEAGERELGRALLERLPTSGLGPLALRRLGLPVDPAAEAARLDDVMGRRPVPDAVPELERRRAFAPDDADAWASLVALRAGLAQREQVAALLMEEDGFAPSVRSLARLAAVVELDGPSAAHPLFVEHCRLYGAAPRRAGLRLAALLRQAPEPWRRDEVLALLAAFHPDEADVALARVQAALTDGRWMDTGALLDGAFPPGAERPPAARAAAIELCASSGRTEEAAGLLEAERLAGAIPTIFLPSYLRVSAELGRWDAALDEGMRDLEMEGRFDWVLAPLVRAARRTGRTAELATRLLALPPADNEPRRAALAALAADLRAGGGHEELAAAAAAAAVGPDGRVAATPVVGRSTAGRDLCIFTCADAAYLRPALACLVSLAATNAALMERAEVRLVAAPAVLDRARAAAGPLGERLGMTLTVVDGGAEAAGSEGLPTAYGLYTGGDRLAPAAYYRIYHARTLAAEGRHRTAVYLDADTIVRPGLAELLDAPTEAALLARLEADRPTVRRAAARHGLAGGYFNSGVLRFALGHPGLVTALERSLRAAADPAAGLFFHDQCALNIGFDGLTGGLADELPRRFNHFVRPGGAEPGGEDAVVLHYLDRPKPWDGLYRGPTREWRGWAELAGKLAGDAA